MTIRSELLHRHCTPLEGGKAMTTDAVHKQLAELPDWALENDQITRTYRFGNYYETLAFVNAIAFMIHREDHHPDLAVGYNRCVVKFSTHSVGGISENDFICAAKCDAIFTSGSRPT